MVENDFRWFYGKILLFGEYTVLLDSMGLSMPHPFCKGRLGFAGEEDSDKVRSSRADLRKYLKYLQNRADVLHSIVDIGALEKDIQAGLFFDSNVPVSYGLGSSGALCAAIYDRYKNRKLQQPINLQTVKVHLSQLEAGFHGKSSGLDPLSSYSHSPLLIHNSNHIEKTKLSFESLESGDAIFLIDTQQRGNTGPLVQSFLKKMKSQQFASLIEKELIPIVNRCVKSICNAKIDAFFEEIFRLSEFQFYNFTDKIPQGYEKLWKEGLDSQRFCLKLCGSGGGGYLLGFTRCTTETRAYLSKMGYAYEMIYPYQN